MPKKVLKEVQKICRVYLWTGRTDNSRKALVSWDHLCQLKSAGGWNFVKLVKAAICKFFLAVSLNSKAR